MDVMMAVQGLRAGLDSSPAASPIRPPPDSQASTFISPEEMTMKRIREALERSSDEGDTLDLSRRGIEVIDKAAVETFRNGVGKESKGVWRYVRYVSPAPFSTRR